MSRAFLVLASLLALCCVAQAKNNQTYSSLKPNNYNVTLAFKIDGVESAPKACSSNATVNAANGVECTVPVLNAASGDAVIITYTPVANYTPPENATVKLSACYSNETSVLRAWRKRNDIIHRDRRCPVLIGKGLSNKASNFTFVIGPNTAPATFTVQLLQNCGTADVPVWCGLGQSKGAYSVNSIDARPGWLIGLIAAFMCVGPIALAIFFVVEKKMKKDI